MNGSTEAKTLLLRQGDGDQQPLPRYTERPLCATAFRKALHPKCTTGHNHAGFLFVTWFTEYHFSITLWSWIFLLILRISRRTGLHRHWETLLSAVIPTIQLHNYSPSARMTFRLCISWWVLRGPQPPSKSTGHYTYVQQTCRFQYRWAWQVVWIHAPQNP